MSRNTDFFDKNSLTLLGANGKTGACITRQQLLRVNVPKGLVQSRQATTIACRGMLTEEGGAGPKGMGGQEDERKSRRGIEGE